MHRNKQHELIVHYKKKRLLVRQKVKLIGKKVINLMHSNLDIIKAMEKKHIPMLDCRVWFKISMEIL